MCARPNLRTFRSRETSHSCIASIYWPVTQSRAPFNLLSHQLQIIWETKISGRCSNDLHGLRALGTACLANLSQDARGTAGKYSSWMSSTQRITLNIKTYCKGWCPNSCIKVVDSAVVPHTLTCCSMKKLGRCGQCCCGLSRVNWMPLHQNHSIRSGWICSLRSIITKNCGILLIAIQSGRGVGNPHPCKLSMQWVVP